MKYAATEKIVVTVYELQHIGDSGEKEMNFVNGNFISNSVAQTREIARQFASVLKGGEVIAFRGGLGAGKTTFTSALAAELECREPVASPTFTLMNTYHGRLTVHHFDLYRISDEDSLYNIGYFDVAGQPDAVTLIEWSENVAAFLPPFDYVIEIRIGADGSREFCFRREEC